MMRAFVLAAVVAGFPAMALADAFDRLAASPWSWSSTCEESHTFSFDEGRQNIDVKLAEAVSIRGEMRDTANYRVLNSGEDWLHLFLEQETWTDDQGQLVTWVLQFIDDQRYVWIRSDWPRGKSTKPVFRCDLNG